MGRILESLRSGDWLTRQRMQVAVLAVLCASTAGIVFLVATSDGLNDYLGRPLGTDFSNVYAAGSLALDGKATAPFDIAQQYARERAIFGAHTPFYGWLYPPFFLLIAAPLALMPYGLALAVWQSATFGLYLLAVRAILKASPAAPGEEQSGRGPIEPAPLVDRPSPDQGARFGPLWLLVAFPVVFINIGHGQNGFLTAALLASALVLLERPILSGILFGLLAYKPQFGVLIPLALAAGGHWRVIAAAAATVAVLVVATTLLFGPEVWGAFLASARFARAVVLEQGGPGWHKIQTVFSWVRMWGGSVALAYALQGVTTVAVAGALVWLWQTPAGVRLKAAAICLAAPLATPYSLDYDLMVLAPAIGFLVADGLARGFSPWEKSLLAALWIVPLIARSVAEAVLIPLAVPVVFAALALTLRQAMPSVGGLPWKRSRPTEIFR
jgi:hypothetical protein